ncbi:hypothetical protein [Halodesulfovibrio marinisediminis]|uniref:Uncharacterized protein n=1 Tax=Halodesulfovibrio marinisediminis DSM 17456 TaxID=1121457 RepID=A0A1N6HH62_9BACT|nr:hypothetical protein [Halodesulfovibrio marinisediminis]SIO19092.1 hypothetical protein SAMN02745161_2205 [Halodesulfovibrio marinisediminis DSM 17456]
MSESALIDKFLPEYTFTECHEIIVHSPIEEVYEIAKNVDLSKSTLIVTLFKLRGLPTRRMTLQGLVEDIGFSRLAENYPVEHLIGFLANKRVVPISSAKEFLTDSLSAKIKVAWNFSLFEISPGLTRITTETRVLCLSNFTRRIFRAYWMFFKPFSSVIRKRMLKIIKRQAELIGWNCYL